MSKSITKNIFLSSLILFLIAALLHFAYKITGNNLLVGIITPVNESVFEHLKLAFYPILGWWIIFYLLKNNKYFLDKKNWFLGCLVSIITSIIIILSFHYVITCGFNINFLFVDILALYMAILIGQFTGYQIYKYVKKSYLPLTTGLIIIMIISFTLLTFMPPKVPFFKDEKTDTYGIHERK